MARFQNGLSIDTIEGHTFSRWLVEFSTQVLGWTLYDNNDAGWSSTYAAAADIATTLNPDELDFSGAVYALTTADAGRYITMLGNAGWSDSEKETIGIYRVTWVDVVAQIAHMDILRGVHEDGFPLSKAAISYRLWDSTASYVPANNTWAVVRTPYLHVPAEPNMDFKITAYSSNGYLPYVSVGPFGTWNNATHAWNDARNTANRQGSADTGDINIWAYGEDDNLMVCITNMAANKFIVYHLGAIDPTAGTAVDTNPGIICAGYCYFNWPAFGNETYNALTNGCRWMAYNAGGNNVAVTGYIMSPSYTAAGSTSSVLSKVRSYSQWSKGLYRFQLMLQSRTAGHMETRGVLKNIWASAYYQGLMPFGTTPDFFLHITCGLTIPWNGSKVHVQLNN